MNISLCSGILQQPDHSSQRFGSQSTGKLGCSVGIRPVRSFFVLSAGAALLIAIATIVIGTWPYERPSIALEPGGEDASFDGVSQLITDASLQAERRYI